MRTRQIHQNREDFDFLDEFSLAKHSRAADDVWYHGYPTIIGLREKDRGPPRVTLLSLETRARRPIGLDFAWVSGYSFGTCDVT
jgi:hypothetical protein